MKERRRVVRTCLRSTQIWIYAW